MANLVKFWKGTATAYAALAKKDTSCIYFVESTSDTPNQVYVGGDLYGVSIDNGTLVTTDAAMAATGKAVAAYVNEKVASVLTFKGVKTAVPTGVTYTDDNNNNTAIKVGDVIIVAATTTQDKDEYIEYVCRAVDATESTSTWEKLGSPIDWSVFTAAKINNQPLFDSITGAGQSVTLTGANIAVSGTDTTTIATKLDAISDILDNLTGEEGEDSVVALANNIAELQTAVKGASINGNPIAIEDETTGDITGSTIELTATDINLSNDYAAAKLTDGIVAGTPIEAAIADLHATLTWLS